MNNDKTQKMFIIYVAFAYIGFIIAIIGICINLNYLKGFGLGFNMCSAICSCVYYKLKWSNKNE